MASKDQIINYCNELLEIDQYQDYCPNGLQVDGMDEVMKIVTGVTACEALIDAAIEAKADMLLVHHGYFWKGESPVISGMKYRRLKKLMEAGISLVAYHLPLDGHERYGNNAQLAALLEINRLPRSSGLVQFGEMTAPMSGQDLAALITSRLGREPLHIPADKEVSTIAWCSGGAQSYFEQVCHEGVDAYLTGEVSEQTVHIAREYGVHFFAAGHHATERGGVKALGEHLAETFAVEHLFVDIKNPV